MGIVIFIRVNTSDFLKQKSSVRRQYYFRKDALRYLQGALEEWSQSKFRENRRDQQET